MDNKSQLQQSVLALLNDDNFLLWRLLPTKELDNYWKGRIESEPILTRSIEEADACLKKAFAPQEKLTHLEKKQLFERISNQEQPIAGKRIPVWLKYAAAAALFLIVSIISIRLYTIKKDSNEKGIVVGSKLAPAEVQLLGDTGAVSLKGNVQISIGADGKGSLIGANGEAGKLNFSSSGENQLIVPYGRRSTIQFADGSKIWLNSGSQLWFPTLFDENERRIRMKGEIYIEVAHNNSKPFFVDANGFETQVLGTKFNISAYEGRPQNVTLVAGSVKINAKNGGTLLKPNEQAVITFGKITTRAVDTHEFTCWKDGYIALNNTPMPEVLNSLERYYNLSFTIEDKERLAKITCNGKFFLSNDMDNSLKVIGLLSNTSYVRYGEKIYISENKK